MCVNFRKLICIDVILKGVKSRIKKKGGVSRKKKLCPGPFFYILILCIGMACVMPWTCQMVQCSVLLMVDFDDVLKAHM